MPTLTSSHSPAPTGKCGNLYDTPVRDAVCAMSYNQDSKAYMASCCNDADIISYYDDCGLYCLAKGQKVKELSRCLYDEGAKWEDVFCRGEEDATATGAGKPLASSDARVVDGDELKKAKDSDKKDDKDDDKDDDNDNDKNDKNDKDDKDDEDDEDADSSAYRKLPEGKFKVVGLLIGLLVMTQMSI